MLEEVLLKEIRKLQRQQNKILKLLYKMKRKTHAYKTRKVRRKNI